MNHSINQSLLGLVVRSQKENYNMNPSNEWSTLPCNHITKWIKKKKKKYNKKKKKKKKKFK